MKESKKDSAKDGNVITYEKVIGRFFICGFIFLFGMILLSTTLNKIVDVLIYGKLNFDMGGTYLVYFCSLFFLLISVGSLIGYFGNKITISDSFIVIRKAALGKKYTISQKYIVAKQTVFTSYKMDNYQIILYLKNGKKVNTGLLNCKGKEEFEKINRELKFEEIISSKMLKEKIAKLKNDEINENNFVKQTNYFLKLITLSPLIILILGIFLFSSGFNEEYGMQDNFHVTGIVVDKKAEKDKNNINYNIVVLDDNTSQKYKIDVNSNVYNYCDLNNKINIIGKRGSLGILYNIYFLKGKINEMTVPNFTSKMFKPPLDLKPTK